MGDKNKIEIIIGATTTDLEKKVKGANATIGSLGDSGKKAAASISGGLNQIKSMAMGLGGILGAGAFLAVNKQLIESASVAEEVKNKYHVVFGELEGISDEWVNTLVSGYAVSTHAAEESLSSLTAFLQPLGMNKKAAAEMSFEFVKLAADLGSFNNLPTEQTLEAIRSALMGEYDPIQRFAGAINAATVESKAMSMGLAENKKDLTSAHKAQAMYKLLLESSGPAIGDVARSTGTYAQESRRLTAAIDDLEAQMGGSLLPWSAQIKGGLADFARGVVESEKETRIFSDSVKSIHGDLLALKDLFQQRINIRDWLSMDIHDLANYEKTRDVIASIADTHNDLMGARRSLAVKEAMPWLVSDASLRETKDWIAELEEQYDYLVKWKKEIENPVKPPEIQTFAPENSKKVFITASQQIEAAQRAQEKAAKDAEAANKRAADAAAKAYESTIDKLLPLRHEQEEYNAALAILDRMDPSHSTEDYTTALKNLEASLSGNISKQNELNAALEQMALDVEAVTAFEESMATVGMTNAEKSIYNINSEIEALYRKNDANLKITGDEEQWAKDKEKIDREQLLRLEDLADKGTDTAEELKSAFSGWASNMSQDLNEMLWGADVSFGGIVKSAGKMVTQVLIQEELVTPLVDIMTGKGSGNSGVLGKLFSSIESGFSTLTGGLSDDISGAFNDLFGLSNEGPSGTGGDPVYVYVTNQEAGVGSLSGSGSGLTDFLGPVSSLTTLFEGGSGWDTVATSIAGSLSTALSSSDLFSTSLDNAVNAFGTTGSAWDNVLSNSGDAWANVLDGISAHDMMSKDSPVGELATTVKDLKASFGPILMGASSAMAAYGAYNQFRQGDYAGGTVSGIGAASSAYQALGGTSSSLIGGAGVVGGAYGLYSGIDDIMKNGISLSNAASTTLSAYSTYSSASMIAEAMGGEAISGAGGLGSAVMDGLSSIGTTISNAMTPALTEMSKEAAIQAINAMPATSAGVPTGGAAAGAGEATGSMAGGIATAAFLAYKAIDMFLVNHDQGIVDQQAQASNGQTWNWGLDMDARFGSTLEGMVAASARATSDGIKDGIAVNPVIEDFRRGMDVLTNQFADSSSLLYTSLESGKITYLDYANQFSAMQGGMQVGAEQAAQMQALASQAAGGSAEALSALQASLEGVGIESFAASQGAVAMASAAEAAQSGYATSTAGIERISATANNYVSSVAGVDIALGESTAMYSAARSALLGNDAALESLVGRFENLGVGSKMAEASADRLVQISGATQDVARSMIEIGTPINSLVHGLDSMTFGINNVSTSAESTTLNLSGMAGTFNNFQGAVAAVKNPVMDLSGSIFDLASTTTNSTNRLGFAIQGLNNLSMLTVPHAGGGIVGYAGGGVLEGGSGIADDIYLGTVNNRLQMAQGGEYIMPPEQTRKHLSELEAMRRDEYAGGGILPMMYGITASAGVTNPAEKWFPEVDGILSDIDAIMRGISNTISGATKYNEEVQKIKESYAASNDQLKKLNASEAQLMQNRQAQDVALRQAAARHKEDVNDFMEPFWKLDIGMSDFASGIYDIEEKYRDALDAAKEMGLAEYQLDRIRRAEQIDLQKYRASSLNESDYATLLDYKLAQYAPSSFAGGANYVPKSMLTQVPETERIFKNSYSLRADESNADLMDEIKALSMALNDIRSELVEIKRTNATISYITEKSDSIGPAPARAAL